MGTDRKMIKVVEWILNIRNTNKKEFKWDNQYRLQDTPCLIEQKMM